VLRAHPAGSLEGFAQCPASSVKTHRGIVDRDAEIAGDLLQRLILKLHPQQDLAVLRFQGLGQVIHTAADLAKQRLIYRGLPIAFAGEPFL